MKTLIVILGPTGVGKTEIALSVAERLGIPIINADSRQIFRELPIGTAAPTEEQMRRVRHFFVGNHSITDYYSAAQYETDVLALLDGLFCKSDVALLCGGSMMYIDAVCKGIDDIPSIDNGTREMMRHRLHTEGLDAMLSELQRLDPEYYAVVDHNNPRRVIHALEICHVSGRSYSSFRSGTAKRRKFAIRKIGLVRPREEMYARINKRVVDMMEKGLEDEARKVYGQRGLNALNTVGYKELFKYFDGMIDKDEAVRQIQCDTRRYMRKQLTWFSHDSSVSWHHPDDNMIIDRIWQ